MLMRVPFNDKYEKLLQDVIVLINTGHNWLEASDLLKTKNEMMYVTERLVRLGMIWEESFFPSEKEKKVSLEIARKRYDVLPDGWVGYALEKILLEGKHAVKSSPGTVFVYAGEYMHVCDMDVINPTSLDFASLEKIEESSGWYVKVDEDEELRYVPVDLPDEVM
jgi:hypothetical protein